MTCALGQNYPKAPGELVNAIATYDFKSTPKELVSRCLSLCYPDSQMRESDGAVLTPLVANIDGGPYPEVLALVGWDEWQTTLVVFKRTGDDWYLIFAHPVDVYDYSPELKVANNASLNKVFYVRQLYSRGTGVYGDEYEYFKLINGSVRKCFELVNEDYISGWGLYLNHDVQTVVSFASSGEDMMWVKFKYSFYSGALGDSDSVEAHPELPFVEDQRTVFYRWDSINSSYVQAYPPGEGREGGLSDAQIACMGKFGSDSLFVSAFAVEIEQRLKNGKDEEKKLLSRYLEWVWGHRK